MRDQCVGQFADVVAGLGDSGLQVGQARARSGLDERQLTVAGHQIGGDYAGPVLKPEVDLPKPVTDLGNGRLLRIDAGIAIAHGSPQWSVVMLVSGLSGHVSFPSVRT